MKKIISICLIMIMIFGAVGSAKGAVMMWWGDQYGYVYDSLDSYMTFGGREYYMALQQSRHSNGNNNYYGISVFNYNGGIRQSTYIGMYKADGTIYQNRMEYNYPHIVSYVNVRNMNPENGGYLTDGELFYQELGGVK